MLVILTGPIGIGKTTVCRHLVEAWRSQNRTCGGILTYKKNDGIEIEDIQTGVCRSLASSSEITQGPRTPQYYFYPEGINFGIGAIIRGQNRALLIIDEIGQLELHGQGFINALDIMDESNNDLLVVIREALLSRFLSKLKCSPQIFNVTLLNRDTLPSKIVEKLFRVPNGDAQINE